VGLLVGTDALNFARTADETAAKTVAETVQILLMGMVMRLLRRPLLLYNNQKCALRSGADRPLRLYTTKNPHCGQAQTPPFF